MDSAELRNCVRGSKEGVALWHQVCDEMETKQTNWVKSLRDAGIKAAHPNDGWVNRDSNELFFAYPQFNDGACIGDLVMLGWPTDEKSQRLVRLIGKRETSLGMMTWWKFQDVSNAGGQQEAACGRSAGPEC